MGSRSEEAAAARASRRPSPVEMEEVIEAAEIMLSAAASPRAAPLAGSPAADGGCGLLSLLAAAPRLDVEHCSPAAGHSSSGHAALPSPSASTEVGDADGDGPGGEEEALAVLAFMRRQSRAGGVDEEEDEGDEDASELASDAEEEEDDDGDDDDDDGEELEGDEHGSLVGRKRGNPEKDDYESWTEAEDKTLREAVARRGTRAWAAISSDELSGRSRHACRNRWRRLAGRRLAEGWLDGPKDKRAKDKRAKAEAWGGAASSKRGAALPPPPPKAASAKRHALPLVAPSSKARGSMPAETSAAAPAEAPAPAPVFTRWPARGLAAGCSLSAHEELSSLPAREELMLSDADEAAMGMVGDAHVAPMVA